LTFEESVGTSTGLAAGSKRDVGEFGSVIGAGVGALVGSGVVVEVGASTGLSIVGAGVGGLVGSGVVVEVGASTGLSTGVKGDTGEVGTGLGAAIVGLRVGLGVGAAVFGTTFAPDALTPALFSFFTNASPLSAMAIAPGLRAALLVVSEITVHTIVSDVPKFLNLRLAVYGGV